MVIPTPAEVRFLASSCANSLTVPQWCSLYTDTTECCGICPNPPVTGPGSAVFWTIFPPSMILIMFLNLIDATWGAGLQLMGGNAASWGVVFSLFKSKLISEFHVSFAMFPPLTGVPVFLCAALTDTYYLFGRSKGDELAQNNREVVFSEAGWAKEAKKPNVKLRTNAIEPSPKRRALQKVMEVVTQNKRDKHVEGEADMLLRTKRAEYTMDGKRLKSQKDFFLRGLNTRILTEHYLPTNVDTIPRPYLPRFMSNIMGFHLVHWCIMCMLVFGFDFEWAQPNCYKERAVLRHVKTSIGLFFFFYILWGAIFWYLNAKAIRNKQEVTVTTVSGEVRVYKTYLDTTQYLCLLWRRFINHETQIHRNTVLLRHGIVWGTWAVWAIMFLTIYLVSVHEFLFLGTTPLEIGQMGALTNSVIPIILVVRLWFDRRYFNKAYYRDRCQKAKFLGERTDKAYVYGRMQERDSCVGVHGLGRKSHSRSSFSKNYGLPPDVTPSALLPLPSNNSDVSDDGSSSNSSVDTPKNLGSNRISRSTDPSIRHDTHSTRIGPSSRTSAQGKR